MNKIDIFVDPSLDARVAALILHAYQEKSRIVLLCLAWEATGDTVRLLKTRGPRGHVHSVHQDRTVASFPTEKLLRYLFREGIFRLGLAVPGGDK